jgi:hypothetical protein
MEGTSGAAERALLRGGVREAALSGEPTAVGMLGAPARERRARGEFDQGATRVDPTTPMLQSADRHELAT